MGYEICGRTLGLADITVDVAALFLAVLQVFTDQDHGGWQVVGEWMVRSRLPLRGALLRFFSLVYGWGWFDCWGGGGGFLCGCCGRFLILQLVYQIHQIIQYGPHIFQIITYEMKIDNSDQYIQCSDANARMAKLQANAEGATSTSPWSVQSPLDMGNTYLQFPFTA